MLASFYESDYGLSFLGIWRSVLWVVQGRRYLSVWDTFGCAGARLRLEGHRGKERKRNEKGQPIPFVGFKQVDLSQMKSVNLSCPKTWLTNENEVVCY